MQRKGYYTGKCIEIQQVKYIIGKISGYNYYGVPFYDLLDINTKEVIGDILHYRIRKLLIT